jgi:NADH:ubiquinone oxidoreductase subunit 6 (subunit J)
MPDYKAITWKLMYIGAILCALICVAMVYKIATTGDTSDEWIVWVTVVVGFCLFGFGFVYEGRSKQPEDGETLMGAGGAKAV